MDPNLRGDYFRLRHAGGPLDLELSAPDRVRLQLFRGTGRAVHQGQALRPDAGPHAWNHLPPGEYTVLVYGRAEAGTAYDLSWSLR